MKSPTNYGSENEETRFIRRVAAPDRPSNKRRQKKRLAIAGATLGLLAASAGVGYATLKSGGSTSAVQTAKLEANMANEAFVSELGDAFHPNFEKVDQNGDGTLSKGEILADLTDKEMIDVEKVKSSDLPDDIKENVLALLEGKLKSDSDCASEALDQREIPVTKKDHKIFYYMLDVFCPRVTIAVTPPDQSEEGEAISGETQQTVEIPTPDGGTSQAVIVGEPVDGKQTIAIPDGDGGYSTTEVKSIETPTGEQKILIPNAEGDITPVVVPEVPEEVAAETTEDTQVVDVVTPSGETEQVIIEGEPEHGEQKVEIPDNEGGYTETEAKVEETPSGEEKLIVQTTDGDVLAVPVPEPIEEENNKETEVQQTIDVTTATGEKEQVTIIGEVEHGETTVQIENEQGQTTTEEVKAVETASGEEKLVLPDVEEPVVVPEVPEEVKNEAELTGEQPQVVDVVTPSGETQQVIVVGEAEHGEQTVEIVDEHGETTTEQVSVEETPSGEEKLVIPELEEPVIVPEPAVEEPGLSGENTEVQQTIDVTTATGEKEQVTIIGEVEHGETTVQIENEQGQTTTEEVKAVETASGEEKLVLPDVEEPVVVPEVPEEVKNEAELTGEQPQVVDVVTPSGETQQVIVVGEAEHGEQTVEIVDEHGETTTEQVSVEETPSGEEKLVIPELEEPVIVPEPAVEEPGLSGENTEVQQTIDVTTATGEKEQVTIIGEVEHGETTVQIENEQGQTTTEEVKAVETASGEEKLVLPDVEEPVVVPEVPEEVKNEAELTGEQPQVVDVVTPSGETQQVIVVGEAEHGEQTVEIVDEHGETTTEQVSVEETPSGEEKLVIPELEEPVIVPEPAVEEPGLSGENTEVQQTIDVTTATGEKEQVTIIGEVEHGETTVQIENEQGQTTTEEVKAVETASGEEKLVLPDVEEPVVVPEVPEEVKNEAELTGEQPQVVDVVTPSGETQQVIVVGEAEHGEQTVEIVDEHGETTTEQVSVEETPSGEEKLVIPELEEPVIVPEPAVEEPGLSGENTEVQQTIDVTTATGEKEQVTIIGEVEHGETTVQIENEQGQTTTEEVKAVETASGEEKLVLPDVEEPVVVPEVPEEVKNEAELTGEQPQVVDVVTPSGETQQVIVVGEAEHGEQTVEIVDEHGETTTEQVSVEETPSGEEKLVIPELEEPVIVPEPAVEEPGLSGENTEVQQTIDVTTATGEKEQVTIIGEVEHGETTVQIENEQGQTTTEEVKAVETASGEEKLVLPDVEEPVVVPEVPEEVKNEAELTGEQPQVVDVVTPSGETQQVIVVGEAEHGEQTVEIVDEHGETTTEQVSVEETPSGEEKLVIPELEEPVIVPEPAVEEPGLSGENTEVQQTIDVTTATGEKEQVTIIGEVEHGETTVQIENEQGQTTTEEVKAVETASGEEKLVLPDVEEPVVVPEVPEEVKNEAELTGEQPQVVDVVTPSGETQQVIVVGEAEHGEQTVEIVDEHGETTTEQVSVEETPSGEEKLVIPELEEPVIVPEPAVDEPGLSGENTEVQQTIDVTTATGEKEQVTIIGEVEHGETTVQIENEQGQTTTEEVKAVETASGEEKLVLPDVEEPVVVPEVPEEVKNEAELTGEQPQVVDVVTPSGETQQVIVVGEAEHGEQTVEIVDEHGETTTEQVSVEETPSGEEKLVIPELEEPVIVPEPAVEEPGLSGENTEVQQTIDVTTATGEKEQVTIIGEVEHGETTVQIENEQGQTTTEEVKAVETASGEEKLVLPDVEEPVVVPEVPEEVKNEAELTGEQPQVVDVVTPSGETQQVIVVGEAEHGEQTVEIVDEHGETTTEQVSVEETPSGEEKLVIPELEEPVIVPEPAVEEPGLSGENTEVQQTIDVTTATGEKEQVTIIGEVEHGETTVQIENEQGQTTTEEVKAVETASGEEKLVLPDVEEPVVVPEVPEEVKNEAELTGEQPQVVDVVTPSGETQQVIVVGEAEHGEQTVEIVDEHGETTTEQVSVEETPSGEEKLVIPELEEPVIVPEPAVEEPGLSGENTEVQQTIDVTTATGEKEQVTIIGEVEHGETTVQIENEQGQTTTEEVKAVETASGEEKLVLPDVEEPVVVPEVPEEVKNEAELTGEQPQVVDVVTPSGETQQVIVVGEAEHGEQTVEIVDEHGETTTEQVSVEETPSGEEKLVIPELEEPVIVPEPAVEEPGLSGENTEVQQTIDVTTATGEKEQVTIIGEVEHGETTVQIENEQGQTTTEEVKAVETASGEEKLVLPDVEEPVVVPEVPEEVKNEAELTGEQPQVVDVVTPSGETQQVIVVGEAEHGEQTVEIVDEHGETTTEQVSVEETPSGEEKLVIPELEEPVIVPEPAVEEPGLSGENTEVQQTIDVTTATGEKEQVTIIGEVEHGETTVQIENEQGQTTTEEVKAVETASGEEKLVLPDVEEPVVVPEVPEEVKNEAELTGEQPQVVDVVTPSGETQQVIVVGEAEHGEQTVEIVDEHGETTTEQVSVEETPSGEEKLVIPELEEPVIVPEPAVEEPGVPGSTFMTKVEFRDWIAKHYEEKVSALKAEEEKLAEEEKEKAGRVQVLQDCIEQAANKFGFYGVYEQPPHFQNAVDWVQNDCWAADRWEPESPEQHRMLRS
ncbi:hypothetical protein KRP22_006820 [Phytophthora ramorum]|nr:hypothetical protein KRP22_2049 [Phytophthora ramorum]